MCSERTNCCTMLRSVQIVFVICSVILYCTTVEGSCVPRNYGRGSVVCVDSVGQCGLPGAAAAPAAGTAVVVTSNKAGLRWHQTAVQWRAACDGGIDERGSGQNKSRKDGDGEYGGREREYRACENKDGGAEVGGDRHHGGGVDEGRVLMRVDRSRKFQRIIGFGGAFTDAAALNIHSLPPILQDCVIRSYFGPEGLQYNMGRVPIGGTDFSTRPYTYDDLPAGHTDDHLRLFSLQQEDLNHKLPLIRAAMEARASSPSSPLKLVASPWSAPAWMKDSQHLAGKGKLLPQYWEQWARYIVKFLQEYRRQGVLFWGVTAQNEPIDGLISAFPFNAMGWTAEEQSAWVGEQLGPALESSGLGDTRIFVLDDNRISLPSWLHTAMSNNRSRRYVAGVAVHWYTDWLVPVNVLDQTHQMYPDVPLLYTEACTGQWPWQPLKVVLGSWKRAQDLLAGIMKNFNHWVVGWLDWNLALDTKGGPNWVKNYVDAPIIVNASGGEVYKQPMYYALAHLSKYLVENSQRVAVQQSGGPATLQTLAFTTPRGTTVLLLLNRDRVGVAVEIRDNRTSISLDLTPKSITTVVW